MTAETSYGFAVTRFAANVLLEPLDPWQRLAVIHAGELLPDGTPRFRYVLILVARQNGKTHLLRVLTLYWLFVEAWSIILGLSTTRAYAKRQLKAVHTTAVEHDLLSRDLPGGPYRGLRGEVNNEGMTTTIGSEYLVAAPNSKAGRSLSIDRAIIDELREHRARDAWDAVTGAMSARPEAQAFCITNQGDDKGIVLDWLHTTASESIDDPDTDVCLLEWSAAPGASLLDPEAWKAANPNLGHRLPVRALVNEAKNVAANPLAIDSNGRTVEASFRTEKLCQRVRMLDAAIDPTAWHECGAKEAPALASRSAWVLDVSRDHQHVSLVGAAITDDARVALGVIKAWDGPLAVKQAKAALPALVKERKPQAFGWLPNSPAAVFMSELTKPGSLYDRIGKEIRSEVPAVCMGFAAEVMAHNVVHLNDALLDDHVTGTAKYWHGDVWTFKRKDDHHCDAAYAAAAATYLARTLPKPVGKPRLIVAREE